MKCYNPEPSAEKSRADIILKIAAVLIWLGAALCLLMHRDELTVEKIVNFTPKNPALAILIILFLYALKGISMPIYGGILYAASGIIFPLPTAARPISSKESEAGAFALVPEAKRPADLVPRQAGGRAARRFGQYVFRRERA